MKTLDAKAAAEVIHKNVNIALATDQPNPEDRHTLAYVSEVCDNLGLEPTAHNCTIVTAELVKAGIVPHTLREYPKVIGRRAVLGSDGKTSRDENGHPRYEDVIAHNGDDEKSWNSETQPVLDAEGKPVLDAKGEPRSVDVLTRADDEAPVPVAARSLRGPYPKVVGRRQLFGADGKPLRDALGAERTQDTIVNNEAEENAYYEGLQRVPANKVPAADSEPINDANSIQAKRDAENAARNARPKPFQPVN